MVAPAAVSVDALLRARLDDTDLRGPTRIYARPLVLYPGMTLGRERVQRHLQRLGYRLAEGRRAEIGEYRLGRWEWSIGRRAFRHYDRLAPGGVATVAVGWDGRVGEIRDAAGRRLEYLALEPEVLRTTYGPSHEDRVPVPLQDIPPHQVDAVLAIEDRHFFQHHGLDLKRIAGATVANLEARRIVQGASTLTQQLAKNLYLSPRRSAIRKLREVTMALALEQRHSKEEILEAYLNQVYLGQDGALAIHGVGRAAQFYFGKDVTRLSLAEAALLAGIIRGPSLYSPHRHPAAAKERRDLVLRLMHEQGLVSEGDYRRAQQAPLGLRARPEPSHGGRYFTDFVAERVRTRLGADVLRSGHAVFTTLDPELQRLAEEAVRGGLERLEAQHPQLVREDSPLQAALVALDPRTGAVLAMVGGRDYGQSQFNRAAQARRQPGSAFKPVVALAALAWPGEDAADQRPRFTLASIVEDEPLAVETPTGLWQPANYDGRFRGPLTLREALERSLNVPFARLGLAVGPERIVATAKRLGIESQLKPYPSTALGASEITPLELTRAFGTLAAYGFRADLHATVGVVSPEGEILERFDPAGRQVFEPAEAYLITSALSGAVERGTGRGLRARGYRGAVAAKSGTTSDFRDGWFVGYTPTMAVGVWVGFDDGRSIERPGSRAALPIFAQFLAGAAGGEGNDDFEVPWGIEVVEIDPETGLRGGPGCWGEPEVFLRGTAPQQSCSRRWAWDQWRDRARSVWDTRVTPLLRELRRRLERRRD
jgi:penicillin-binding protein 1B